MTELTRLYNQDNGLVDMTTEAILDGKDPCKPELICTKYPEMCTPLKVEAALCDKNPCCTKEL